MLRRTAALVLTAALSLSAQVFERTASIRGNGNPYNGKCTIEVVVDGAAQVEIRGDQALLRNLAGRPPEWRRFECSGVMGPNPGEFRFQGIDGRGRQTLVREPRRGGVAVVLLEDNDNGSEGYTFDILWSTGGPVNSGDMNPRGGVAPRGDNASRIFERTRQDLERAAYSLNGRGDEFRLERVYEELNQLQRDYARGRANPRDLDDVIDALRRVLRDNRLTRRDRDNLADDLDRLRDLR